MKKFLFKTLVFVSLLLVLAIPADIIITRQFFNTTDFRYVVWNDILKGGMNNDIIVMGSSRSWKHISPQVLDSVLHTRSYNIGIDGSRIDRQIPRYKIYRKYNKKPKVIIQNVDWGSTLSIGQRTDYLKEQYLPYFYNNDMRDLVIKPEGFDFFDLWIPLLRYIRYKNLYNTIEIVRDLDIYSGINRGYNGSELFWNGSSLEKIDSVQFSYTKSSLCEFCNYLSECKNDSIKVVFVYAPYFIEGTRRVTNLSEFYNLFDSVANEYDCLILDYLDSQLCYDTTYFYNAMHLNKKGAELFSAILAHDLDSLNLLNGDK